MARAGLAYHIEVVRAVVVSDTEGDRGEEASIADLCNVVAHRMISLYYGVD